MKDKIEFSIILPVLNQEDHIEKVIRDFYCVLSKGKLSFELIAVVNGSNDRSFEICQKMSKLLPNVSAYNLIKGGYGRAVIYGLSKAKGRYLCYVNSARMHIDELYFCINKFLESPQGIVHGIRIKRDVLPRKIGSFIYNTTCRLLTGVNSPDINGTPKIFSRKTLSKIKLTYVNSMIDLELLEQARKKNIPVIHVPIYKNIRHGGKSTSNFRTIFRLIGEVFIYWYKNHGKK